MNQARVTRLEREVRRLSAQERAELFGRFNTEPEGVGAPDGPIGATGAVGVSGGQLSTPRFPGAKLSRAQRPLDPPRVQAIPGAVPGGSPTPWTEEDAPGATEGGAALAGEGEPVA